MHKKSVKMWLRGQKKAAAEIEKERTRFLLTLSPKEALTLFLTLKRDSFGPIERREPSPVLLSMRRALRRLEKRRTA